MCITPVPSALGDTGYKPTGILGTDPNSTALEVHMPPMRRTATLMKTFTITHTVDIA